MTFRIQTSNPSHTPSPGVQVEGLALAIQTVFPLTNEAAILIWNRIPVLLSYKYDLGDITHDLLPALQAILTEPAGDRSVSFSSTTFSTRWDLHWRHDQLTIVSSWHSITGGYESILNSRHHLDANRLQFLCEWKGPLRRILDGIDASGITVIDTTEQLEDLRQIEAALPRFGQLYNPSDPPATP